LPRGALEAVGPLVRRHLVGLAADVEARATDAVGDTPGDGTEMRRMNRIVVERFEPKHYRPQLAAHRHPPVADHDAPVDQVDLDAIGRCQCVLLDLFATERAERLDRHHDTSLFVQGTGFSGKLTCQPDAFALKPVDAAL